MSKRRAEPMFFPVDLSTFGDQRFGVVATERGEPVQLIWGRFFPVAAQAYKARTEFLSREAVQLAAGLPKREPWFADQLVDADLATRSEDGFYRLAGVRDRLQAIEESYAKAVADGRKGAEKRWGTNRGANESDGDPIGFDGRVTVTERSTNRECGASRSHSSSSEEKISSDDPVPTEADTAVLDLGATAEVPPDPLRIPFGHPDVVEFLQAYDVSSDLCHKWIRLFFHGDAFACEAALKLVIGALISNDAKLADIAWKRLPMSAYLAGALKNRSEGLVASRRLEPLEQPEDVAPVTLRLVGECDDEGLPERITLDAVREAEQNQWPGAGYLRKLYERQNSGT